MYITQKILTEVFDVLDEELDAREKALKQELNKAIHEAITEIKELLVQFKNDQIELVLPKLVETKLDSVLELKIKRLKPVLLENTLFTLIKQNVAD